MAPLAKILMLMGALLFLAGVVVAVGARFGLGNLPGDISFRRGNTSVYFPIVTSILVSIGLTVLINIVLRFWR
ncbi:MAG TPA: DUF2905 domain-containing protein [Abditibacteriaceae bacterium]|jgi:hypothetical protein